jgi:hypothetical protein
MWVIVWRESVVGPFWTRDDAFNDAISNIGGEYAIVQLIQPSSDTKGVRFF